MGLVARDSMGWLIGPHPIMYILIAIIGALFWAILIVILLVRPFFYPGAIMVILLLWLALSLVNATHKLKGYHSKNFRVERKDSIPLVQDILTDLGLDYARDERIENSLIYMGISWNRVYSISDTDLHVCLRFIYLSGVTEIYIGRVEPWNVELAQNFKKRIEDGVRERKMASGGV